MGAVAFDGVFASGEAVREVGGNDELVVMTRGAVVLED